MESDVEEKTIGREKEIKEDKQKKAADAEVKKEEIKAGVKVKEEKPIETKPEEKTKETEKPKEEIKPEEKKEVKKPEAKKPKIKKTEAVVRGYNIPISTKQSVAICKFIRRKKIGDAIRDLEKVSLLKKAVPMKGELPHKKGKIMSGKYPKKAAQRFIILLKSLAANSSDIDDPIIVEAVANLGERPYGRFGQVRRKRSHIYVKAKEKKLLKKKKTRGKKQKNGRKKNS